MRNSTFSAGAVGALLSTAFLAPAFNLASHIAVPAMHLAGTVPAPGKALAYLGTYVAAAAIGMIAGGGAEAGYQKLAR